MSISFIIILLVLISAATFLLMSAAKLYLQSLGWMRSSETVNDNCTAIDADARSSEAVMPVQPSEKSEITTIEVSTSELTMDAHNSPPSTSQFDVILPSSPEEWSRFDEPACRRRPGEFVNA